MKKVRSVLGTLLLLVLMASMSVLVFVEEHSLTKFFPSASTDSSDKPPLPSGEEQRVTKQDWFNHSEWNSNRHTTKCAVLEDICHSSQRWFRRPGSPQPSQEIVLDKLFTSNNGYPATIKIETSIDDNLTCTESTIANHFVLFGSFAHMLGEFYMRVLLGFYQLLSELNSTRTDADAFKEHTQLYLHLNEPSKTILDSHTVFTEIFRGGRPLLDFKDLLHATECQCKKRLILCGYDQRKGGKQTIIYPGGALHSDRWPQAPLKELRNDLRQKVILSNPLVQEQIKNGRKEILLFHNVTVSEWKDWSIVGLAQRKLRRKWKGLKNVTKYCNLMLRKYNSVCVKVYVDDETSNPFWQVIRHGVLDVLIGIHGAQMTEALWMKPGALVVELLPFVPKERIVGSWTRTTDAPTPLGVIYHNTDLNHIGYPLNQTSLTDNCSKASLDEVNECYGKGPRWDNRDFRVAAYVVTEAVRRFHSNETSTLCQNWQNKSAGEYVLYSINCRDSPDEEIFPHHYYWPKENK